MTARLKPLTREHYCPGRGPRSHHPTLKQPFTNNMMDAILRTLTDEELAWPLPWTQAQWQQYEARQKGR